MIAIGKDHKFYYIDLNAIDEFVRLDKKDIEEYSNDDISNDGEPQKNKMYSIIKYDIIRAIIEGVLNEYPDRESDIAMYQAQKQTSIPFALSFNTLLRYDLIKEI